MIKACLLMCIGLLLATEVVVAEPWLAQRYSQNCTACHAPGRVNKPFKDKRFAMTCTACHENPNGGGMRNHYGKWLQDHWLKSHTVNNWITGKIKPAPLNEQAYASQYPGAVGEQAREQNRKNKKSVTSKVKTQDTLLVRSMDGFETDEKQYDKTNDLAHEIVALNTTTFEAHIPKEDPYWKDKKRRLQAGFDLRHFMVNAKVESESASESLFMADAGLAFKILKKPNLSLVGEYRYFSEPYMSPGDMEEKNGLLRSAYFKADQLPYNSFAMLGLYRPMFGLHRANFFTLRDNMVFMSSGGAHQAVYEGLTLGSAPGERAFLNVSLLTSLTDTGDKSKGYVLNAGGSLEFWGLNALISFWNTQREDQGEQMAKQMLSVSGGFNIENQWIGNSEIIFFKEDTNPSVPIRNSGYVAQVDLKRRLWREYYLNLNASWANTTRIFSEGNVQEVTLGFKAYLLPSMDVELLYTQGTEKSVDALAVASKIDYGQFLLQTHLFW